MPDSQAPQTLVEAVRLLLAAGLAGGGVKWFEAWRGNRRQDRLDPTKTVADAAESVAQSAVATVEALIAPLRAELAIVREDLNDARTENSLLRAEVHLLREALHDAGLPIPKPKAVS